MRNENSNKSIRKVDKYDALVVGCGMAGLAAGIRLAEKDVSVVILEKAPKEKRGGQTQYSESFRIPTADIDLDLDFHVSDYSSTDFYRDIMRITNGKADPGLAKTLTNNAAETFEWLTELGLDWELRPQRTLYETGRVWHDGEQLIRNLVRIAENKGADIKYKAEARKLLQGKTSRVRGIRVLDEDEWKEYYGDAVILACGGYESNAEKRTTYYGGPFEEIKVRGVRYNTGEAIDMALDIGAKSVGQWSGAHMTVIDAGSPDVEGGQTLVSGYQYGIILNHNGQRFLDEGEDIREHTYAKFGRIVFEQGLESFMIQDSKTNEYVEHTGPTDPITGKTIEELVTRLGIDDKEQAIRTFKKYNKACSSGEFDPYTLDGNRTEGITPKKSNWAIPLDNPPLYGYPVAGGITFTFGGLAQTKKAEVINTSDRPISGLYAAGNCTGGFFYDNYPGGTGIMKAAVFGKIAGEEVAKTIKRI